MGRRVERVVAVRVGCAVDRVVAVGVSVVVVCERVVADGVMNRVV
jgi:hypothetical protein